MFGFNNFNVNIFRLLMAFGILVVLTFIAIDKIFFADKTNNLALDKAQIMAQDKERQFEHFLNKNITILKALKTSDLVTEFHNKQRPLADIEKLFQTAAKSSHDIFQIRLIDKNGNEVVKVERSRDNSEVKIAKKTDLQNKANRYYFTEIKKFNSNQVWHSNLDLNMEYGKIQQPHLPVVRSAIPLFKNNQFDGLIIINTFVERFLTNLNKIPLYKITLVDNEGFILWHEDKSLRWSKQLGTNHHRKELPIISLNANETFRDKVQIAKNLNLPVSNQPIIIIELKENYLDVLNSYQINHYLLVALLALIFIALLSYYLNRSLKQLGLDFESSRLNEKLFKNTFDMAAIGVAHVSLDGSWLKTNHKVLEILDYQEESLLSKNVNDLIHPEEFDIEFPMPAAFVLQKTSEYQVVKKLKTGSGDYIIVSLTISLIEKHDGTPDFLVFIIQDVTYKKQTETQLQQLTHDMGERIKELNCIYAANEISRNSSNIEELLQKTVKIIPTAWHYPEATKAKITFGEQIFQDSVFETTQWRQSSAIKVNNKKLGMIEVFYVDEFPELDEGPFLKQERNLIDSLSLILSETIQRIQIQEQLTHMATHDPLTGLMNRQTMLKMINNEIIRSTRYQRSLSLLILDLDLFKKINDTYGHLTGDKVLISFAKLLQKEVRETDSVVRYGGEEFVILLPETPIEEAKSISERIINKTSELTVEHEIGTSINFTCSIGVANFPEHAINSTQLIALADKALYRAKENGRNQVMVHHV